MFSDIHQELMNGNQEIISYFTKAKSFWEDIWEQPESETLEGLKNMLPNKHLAFSLAVDDRRLAEEVLAITGYAYLHDLTSGFDGENKARLKRLRIVFQKDINLETKFASEHLDNLYHVEF